MVRVIRDFMLRGVGDEAFEKIRKDLPESFKRTGDEYIVECDIEEKGRYYRKGKIRKNSIIEMIPAMIRNHLPPEFFDLTIGLVEEAIFYEKDKKIQWSLCSDIDSTFLVSGSTRFITMEDNALCKVVMIVNLELPDMTIYIPNEQTRKMITPLIESRMPDVFVKNQNIIYQQVCDMNSSP